MQQLMQQNIDSMMSSREIATLTKKDHSHVIRDIRSMLSQIDDPNMDDTDFKEVFDGRGYTSEINLNKDLTLTLVAGYNSRFRYLVIKRWQELEAQVSTPAIPQSYAEALQLAANQARQLELAKPKVMHYDNVVERAGLLNATQVAQKVRLSAVAMNKVLDELGVYNKAVKRSRVFQQWFIDKGLGEVKQTDQGFSQALFTKRGEAWIIERLISEGVA